MKMSLSMLLVLGFFCFGIAGCGNAGQESAPAAVTKTESAAQQSPSADKAEGNNQSPQRGTGTTDLRSALLGGHFVLQSVDGDAFPGGPRQPEIRFDENLRVSGRVCNQFTGAGELEGDTLFVKQMASTKMLCIEPHLNKLEHAFSTTLSGKGMKVALDGPTLTLQGEGLTVVYTKQ
ncbi:META domain-containing protein [Desulfovibrio sp. OttesenSCG-928-G15]|nr:META domain-containing protein [Desulfovibrio sp. OttesenSCG-928-G15]